MPAARVGHPLEHPRAEAEEAEKKFGSESERQAGQDEASQRDQSAGQRYGERRGQPCSGRHDVEPPEDDGGRGNLRGQRDRQPAEEPPRALREKRADRLGEEGDAADRGKRENATDRKT